MITINNNTVKNLRSVLLTGVAVLALASCEKYDDSGIYSEIDALELENKNLKIQIATGVLNGTNGTDGSDGADGAQGIAGLDGVTIIAISATSTGNLVAFSDDTTVFIANGSDGSNGTNGINGINGSNGTNGSNGAQGIAGIAGSAGATGTIGIQGVAGNNGAAGSNGSDGANGLAGSDGTNGTNGTNGSDGSQGIAGSDGTNGSDGSNGSDGTNGTNGTNGSDGSNGNDGSNGSDGSDGSDGQNGNDGTNGTNGNDGSDGSDGSDGVDGADGQDASQAAVDAAVEDAFLQLQYEQTFAKVRSISLDTNFGQGDAGDAFTINVVNTTFRFAARHDSPAEDTGFRIPTDIIYTFTHSTQGVLQSSSSTSYSGVFAGSFLTSIVVTASSIESGTLGVFIPNTSYRIITNQ